MNNRTPANRPCGNNSSHEALPPELEAIAASLRGVQLSRPPMTATTLRRLADPPIASQGRTRPRPSRPARMRQSWTALALSWASGAAVGVAATIAVFLMRADRVAEKTPLEHAATSTTAGESAASGSVATADTASITPPRPDAATIEAAIEYAALWRESVKQSNSVAGDFRPERGPFLLLTTPEAIERFLNERRLPEGGIVGDGGAPWRRASHEIPPPSIIRPVDARRAAEAILDGRANVDI